MASSRLCERSLSAFKSSTRLWAPVSARHTPRQVSRRLAPGRSDLSLITWNLDAFSPRPIARANLILGDILEESALPDIVFLQEVTSDVHASILGDAKVREAFLVTDAEDQTSFEGVPFANMTLLSNKRFAFDSGLQEEKEDRIEGGSKFTIGPVSRVELPSKYRRCALSVDIISPSTPSTSPTAYRLINVHLDSLADTFHYRTAQLAVIAHLLRQPGCSGGLVAGDFNAISPADHALVDENGLVDAWCALHSGMAEPRVDGATWGVGGARRDGLRPGRLDKVAMLGVEAKEMKILRPSLIEVPKPGGKSDYIPCSDHCGLRLKFTV